MLKEFMCLQTGPQLDVPHDVTPKQLETLLNGLLKQEEKLPYSFFVNEQQISEELGTHLLKNKVQPCLDSKKTGPLVSQTVQKVRILYTTV